LNVHDGLRAIFIHNPRCAGSSIEVALGLDHGHDTMRQARERHGEEVWSNYFRFSIVRDPLTRLISTHEFAQAEKSWYHDNLAPGPQGSHGDIHPDYETVKGRSLEECCRMLLTDPTSLKHPGWKPQTHFISDPDGLDFIGRYEDLAEDWKYVCRMLGVDIELPRINTAAQLRDRSDYMTPFVCEFAGRFYRADYAAFGYPLPLPIVPDAAPVPVARQEQDGDFWPMTETKIVLAPKPCCGG